MEKKGKVKFIRVNGRVVPVKGKGGSSEGKSKKPKLSEDKRAKFSAFHSGKAENKSHKIRCFIV